MEQEPKICWFVTPVYYGDRSAAFRGDPYKNAKDYYFECSKNNEFKNTINKLCESCKDGFYPKVEKPRRVNVSKIRRAIVTNTGIEYID